MTEHVSLGGDELAGLCNEKVRKGLAGRSSRLWRLLPM